MYEKYEVWYTCTHCWRKYDNADAAVSCFDSDEERENA